MTASTLTPRVYVACLACYNAGHLVGEWWDTSDLETGFEEWRKTHEEATSHEEYVVHDSEDFGGYKLGEVCVPEAIEIGDFIEEHGIPGALALSHYSDLEEAKTAMDERYQGAHDSLADYAQDYAEQTSDLKSMGNLVNYIDWDRFGRDIEMEGSIWSEKGEDGKLHVFDAH